jgi:2,3-bisphosphoglycerate-independent phosphoglycerate mutase
VEGATGYLGTNYAGKVAAATAALAAGDFVYLHVEAPDETSHEGSLEKKLQAIEEFDGHVVGPCLTLRRQHPDLRILVAPDHATPLRTRTHAAGPVPFAVCGSGISPGGARAYSERSAATQRVLSGEQLMDSFVRGSFA